jgi:hypothetical protein
MPISRALLALLLCSAAARAADLAPVIARPITLPQGSIDVTLHGTYTSWASNVLGPNSLDGETLALGLDFGASDQVQLGLGVVLPINPGAGFGSVLGSAAFAASPAVAVRVDAGYESIGFNGDNTSGTSHSSRYFAGLGAPLKVPISPTVAFVSGHGGALHFGHFNNVGTNGTGLYWGSTIFTEAGSDLLVFSTGKLDFISGNTNDTFTYIGINLPFGLLLQPDPVIAVTLLAGYSAAISVPSGPNSSTQALHFLPVGLEAVVTPVPALDIGLRFSIDGYVAHSGNGSGNLGYFDMRALMFWLSLHA